MSDEPQRSGDPSELGLASLSDRHHGVTQELGAAYAQAAAVYLSRHHLPPVTVSVSWDAAIASQYALSWTVSSERIRSAWAHTDDATRDGAYGVVLASAEAALGLVALGRTKVGSGADYWVGPTGTFTSPTDGLLDMDTVFRLEISGIDDCPGESALTRRLRQKMEQARQGDPSHPAIVGAVAFNMLPVVFRSVE
jgi:hypothetical protein